MPYQIHLWNRANSSKADVFMNATGIELIRNSRGTESIQFQIPRDDPQLSLLTHGVVVRVYEEEISDYLGVGQITGTIDLSGVELVRFEAEGLWARLATVVYPNNYVLEGDISSVENSGRLTQSYDFRRVTSVLPDDSDHDGNVLCSWRGYTASGASYKKATLTGAILYDIVREGATADATGSCAMEGASDDDGDGHKETQPFGVTAVYVSPVYDFGSAPDDYDRLRFGGSYNETEVSWAFETYITELGHSFPAATQPTFPDGVGEDITSSLDRRWFSVRFQFDPNDPARQSPAIFWFEVIARRDIEGISVGTVVSQTLPDNFTVGGMTSLAVLDRICQAYGLEWQVQSDGTVDIQTEPASGAVGATWGTDRRDTYHLIEGHHCNIVAYEKDDERLTNYLIATGTGPGGNALTIINQDSSSQGVHGLRQTAVGFNVDTMAELLTEADRYIAQWKDPRVSMTIEVVETPDNLMSFAPGDLIRVSSFLNQNHDGGDIVEDFRIVVDIRRATPGGIRTQLRLETKRVPFMEDLGGMIDDLQNAVENAIEHTQTGLIITPERSDAAIYDEDIHLGFTPSEEASGAVVLSVEDTTAGVFYGPEEGNVVIRVVGVRVLERTLTIRYERVSGVNQYKAHILWWSSGQVFRPSQIGSGG